MKNKGLVSIMVLICFIVAVTTTPVVLAGKISLKFVTPNDNQVYTVGDKITCSATVSGSNYKHTSFYLKNSTIPGAESIRYECGIPSTSPSCSFETSNLSPGTYYVYAVGTYNDGTADEKIYITITLKSPPLTKPVINKPLNGEVINKSNPTFRVSWEAVSGASKYYYSVRKNGIGSTIYLEGNKGTNDTYLDLNTSVLEYGESYTVFVTAESSTYATSNKSNEISFTVAPKVSELNITYPKSNQVCSEAPIHITWNAVPGVEWYNLYFNDNVSSPQIVSKKYTSYDLNFGTGSYNVKIEAIGNTLQVIASGTVPFTVELKNNVKVLVIDKKTEEFISNAEVILGNSSRNTYYNNACNFFNLENGTYDISCSRSGYKSFTGKINVKNGSNEYKIYMESMPEDYSISGKVTDQRGNPISGALVKTEGGSVITDSNGYFSLEGLKNGKYYINVQKDGYEPKKDVYTIIDGGSITQNINLYKYTPMPPVTYPPTNTPTHTPTNTPTHTPTNTPTNTPKSTPSPASIANKNDSNPYNGGAINVVSSTPTPTPTSTVHENNPATPVPAAVIINNPIQNIPTKIELSESYIEINTSQKKTINAKVSPESALINSSIRWDSDKDYIVSVDNYGNLIARQPGEARITATTVIGGLNASCRVVVMPVNEDEDVVVNPGFSDVNSSHWAYKYIAKMYSEKVISGYPDGKFYPNRLVSRAEFAKMMLLAAGKDPMRTKISSFRDISIEEWYSPFVEGAKNYLTGYVENGSSIFRPKKMANREDMAVAVVKLKGFEDSTYDLQNIEDMFSDYSTISQNLRKYIAIAVEKELISGYPDGSFKAQGSITRAEAAVLLYRAFMDVGYGNKVTG